MNESALRSLIGGLEQQLSRLEWWLYAWTVLVIVGCAGELYFVQHAYLDERRLWKRARTLGGVAPKKPSALVLIFEILSVAAVVVGISGELQVDRKSGDIQTQLRDANSQLVLLLEKETGAAKDSAEAAAKAAGIAKEASGNAVVTSSNAKVAAGNALDLANSAHKEADSLEKDLVSAEEETAKIAQKAANASIAADRERIERLKLEGPCCLRNAHCKRQYGAGFLRRPYVAIERPYFYDGDYSNREHRRRFHRRYDHVWQAVVQSGRSRTAAAGLRFTAGR